MFQWYEVPVDSGDKSIWCENLMLQLDLSKISMQKLLKWLFSVKFNEFYSDSDVQV